MRLDLVKDSGSQRLQMTRDGLGVRILGFKVREHLRIVLVAQPLERVDDPVTMMLTDVIDVLGVDRLGRSHAGTLSDERLSAGRYRE